jgi:hypothetical protein
MRPWPLRRGLSLSSFAPPVSFAGSPFGSPRGGSSGTGSSCPLAVGLPSLVGAAAPFEPTTFAVFEERAHERRQAFVVGLRDQRRDAREKRLDLRDVERDRGGGHEEIRASRSR